MALTPDITLQTVEGDGSEFIIDDDTVYGAPNQDRNEVALSFTAYKVDEDLVETALTVASFDPETATSFTITAYTDPNNSDRILDGWYKFYFMIVDNWDVSTTYNQYDVVWSASLNAFYQYINSTPSAGNLVTNSTYFAAITNPADLIGDDTEPANVVTQVLEAVISFQTSICFTKAASLHAKESCSGADCACDSRLGKLYHKIEDIFTVMNLNDTTEQYLEGERNAREVEKYCDDCGCLER